LHDTQRYYREAKAFGRVHVQEVNPLRSKSYDGIAADDDNLTTAESLGGGPSRTGSNAAAANPARFTLGVF
jgi:hypothetical protein